MNDHFDHESDPATIDTGTPIEALRDLEEPTSDRFMGALHRRIQRRLLAADVGRLSWSGPLLVVVEIFNMLFGLIGIGDPDQGKESSK